MKQPAEPDFRDLFEEGRNDGRRWALRRGAGPEVDRVASLPLSTARAPYLGSLDASAQIAVRAAELSGDEATLARGAHRFWAEAAGGDDMGHTFDRDWLRGFLAGVREGAALKREA